MRCYDGCPDSEYQAHLDDEAKASEELSKIGARATYFPMEGMWMVFKDYKAISGFYPSKRAAASAVLSSIHEG